MICLRQQRARTRLQISMLAALQLCGALGTRAADAQQDLEFERLPAYARAPLPISKLDPARRTGRIVMELPGGATLRLIPRPQIVEVDGTTAIRATAGTNRMLVTTDGGRAYGHVVADGRLYLIDTVDGKPVMLDADHVSGPQPGAGGWRNDAVVDAELTRQLLARASRAGSVAHKTRSSTRTPEPRASGTTSDAAASAGGTVSDAAASADGTAASVIDVAIFVEPALQTRHGSQAVRTRAQAWIDFTNEAFRLNDLPLSLRLVYLGPFDDDLPTDATGDLFGSFARSTAARQTAEEFGADLRHLLYGQDARPGLGYCGMGTLVGDVGISGFECGQHTFAHEIGHNFGAHHDRANVPATEREPGAYNYGYVCGGRGTLMSYPGTGRVDHYSSPQLAFAGQSCGVPIGQPDAAFNGAAIELHRADVERFRQASAPGSTVRFQQSSVVVDERGTAVPFTLVRDGDLSREASVEVGLIDGTATEGEDVRPLLQRVVFAAGESARTLSIEPLNDTAYDEPVETMRAVLRYPRELSVAGEPMQIQVVGSDDPDRGRATFDASASRVYESAGTIRIGVSRLGSASEPLTVSFAPVDASARAGVDYRLAPGQVTFAAGEVHKSIAAEVIDDALLQGYEAYRAFSVRLSGPNLGSTREVRVFVVNDDLRQGRAQFDSASVSTPATAASATLTVRRVDGSEGDLRFDYATSDGSGHAGQDYVASSGQITLANGASAVTLGIPLLDSGTTSERTFTVTLSGPSLGTPTGSTVTIVHAAQGAAGSHDRGGGGSTSLIVLLALVAALVEKRGLRKGDIH